MSFKSVRNEAHQGEPGFYKIFVSYPGDPSVFPVYCDMSNGGEFKVILSLAWFYHKKDIVSCADSWASASGLFTILHFYSLLVLL